jgi:hypothetical protein
MARYSGISDAQLVRGATTVDLTNVESIEIEQAAGRVVTQPADDEVGPQFADVVDRRRRFAVRLRDLAAAAQIEQGAWEQLSFTVAGLGGAADVSVTLDGGGVIVESIRHEHAHGGPSAAVVAGVALFEGASDPLTVA